MSMICGIWLLKGFCDYIANICLTFLTTVVNLRSSASNLTCLLFHISLLFLQHRVTKLWASPNFKSLTAALLFISLSGCINDTFRVIKCLQPSTFVFLQTFQHQSVGSTKMYSLLVVLNSDLIFCQLCSNGKPQGETW